MFINPDEIHYLNKKDSKNLVTGITNITHKLIVLFLLDAGLRVSECVTLKLSNFDFRKRQFNVLTLKKRGKEKYRTIPLSTRLYQALADYLYKTKLTQDSYLFPSELSKEGHLTRFAVNKFLNRYKKEMNIQNLHPHTLRHTCATAHVASGANLLDIKEMLGHSSINTTTIYTHIPSEVLRNNIDKATYEKPTIIQWAKSFFKSPDLLISIPSNTSLPAIGRTAEIEKIHSFACRDINTIVLGDIGVGKSHLLKMVLPENKKVLKLDDLDNIKKSLVYLILYLFKNDKDAVFKLLYADFDLEQVQVKLNRLSIISLCDEIKKLVDKKEYILMIDNVDSVTPKSIRALEELKDTFTILTSAREIPLNKGSFLWNFEIIKLNPLERNHSLDLIQKLSYDLDVEDYELFKNHIYEQSNGNPRVIYEVIERYRKEPVISNEVIRSIRHFGSMKEIDMSMMIIIFLSLLAILRYLSREVDNDSYRFIGGAAMILLVISRYFFTSTKRKFV